MGYTNKSLASGALGGILIATVIIASTYIYFNYGSGNLLILVRDPPKWWGEASHVYIKVSKIEIHRADAEEKSGWLTIIEDPGWINLTDVLDTNKILGEAKLQAGKYDLTRFSVLEAKVTIGRENRTTEVENGRFQIAITHGGTIGVTVNAGQTSKILIDFETMVTLHGKGHRIVPSVKVISLSDR